MPGPTKERRIEGSGLIWDDGREQVLMLIFLIKVKGNILYRHWRYSVMKEILKIWSTLYKVDYQTKTYWFHGRSTNLVPFCQIFSPTKRISKFLQHLTAVSLSVHFPSIFSSAPKKYSSLSHYTDFKEWFHRFLLFFQCICNPCNRLIIGVIRDFSTFSEISIKFLDRIIYFH
jgi:hypothetical protein